MRSGQRRVALHLGLVVLGVLGVILWIGWREFVVAYHGIRLRSDRAAFDELLGAEDGSPGHAALERYARGSKGRERLLSEYLSAGMRINFSLRGELERLGPSATENRCVSFGYFQGKFWRETWCYDRGRSELIVTASSWVESDAQGRLESLQRVMRSSPFELASLSDWPGLAFTVYPRALDPPGTEYRFTDRSQWRGSCMLVVNRSGMPLPEAGWAEPGAVEGMTR